MLLNDSTSHQPFQRNGFLKLSRFNTSIKRVERSRNRGFIRRRTESSFHYRPDSRSETRTFQIRGTNRLRFPRQKVASGKRLHVYFELLMRKRPFHIAIIISVRLKSWRQIAYTETCIHSQCSLPGKTVALKLVIFPILRPSPAKHRHNNAQ